MRTGPSALLVLATTTASTLSAVLGSCVDTDGNQLAGSSGPIDAGTDATSAPRPDAGAGSGDTGAGSTGDAGTTPPPDAESGADAGPAPVVVSSNPNSVLSNRLDLALGAAANVRVTSVGGTDSLSTPTTSLAPDGSGHVWVLGLAPSTSYVQVVTPSAPDSGAPDSGAGTPVTTTFTTPALPSSLAPMSFVITKGTGAPERGYYLIAGNETDLFAVDQTGATRWYRSFGTEISESKMQYDGTFTTFVGTSAGAQPTQGAYVRFTGDGAQTASYQSAPDPTEPGTPALYTDPHELLMTVDSSGTEHLHLLAYEITNPLIDAGASTWSYHELLRQQTDGTVEFRWKCWSRFGAADRLETDLPSDFDHANAIAIDPTDGNYVVSFRNLGALVKLDYNTGEVIWQLGGVQNQFTIVGDPLGGFQGQHSVWVLPNGHILIYDNGLHHNPPETRAVEYALDTTAMTATFVWQFRHTPALFTEFEGSVERLSNGNTLVWFSGGTLDEVDPNGNVVWEGLLYNAGNMRGAYRMRRLPSLYANKTP